MADIPRVTGGVIERRRTLRRTLLLGSVALSIIGWVMAVAMVRMSDSSAEDAIAGVYGEGLGALTPLIMLVVSGLLAALVMLMVSLNVLWRVRLPVFLKLSLTAILIGASYGLFAVVVVTGVYAAGGEIGKLSSNTSKVASP